MGNVLKHAMRSEIEEYLKDQNGDNAENVTNFTNVISNSTCKSSSSSSSKNKSMLSILKKKRSEGRLSNLLSRIQLENSDDSLKRKIKKLHAKYQHSIPHLKDFKHVNPKKRGSVKFIDSSYVVTTLGSIKDKLQSIYFDLDGSNNSLEDQSECMITICDSSGLRFDESKNILDYLERKGTIISKTNVVLISQSCDFKTNNF